MSKPDGIPEPVNNEGATFDVEEWLTSAKPPQRAVVVYGKANLLSELQALAAEPEPAGVTMGVSVRQKRMTRLREELDASRKVFHVRGLLDAEQNDLIAKHTKPSADGEGELDGAAYEVEAYALALVAPTMSVQQVAKMQTAIGAAQWTEIGTAITRASVEAIDVPLSQLGSAGTEDS
jgi:hypothetical protein